MNQNQTSRAVCANEENFLKTELSFVLPSLILNTLLLYQTNVFLLAMWVGLFGNLVKKSSDSLASPKCKWSANWVLTAEKSNMTPPQSLLLQLT